MHGNWKDWDPMGSPWEWECDKPWDGSGMGMGIRRMGMGIKTWEWEKITATHFFRIVRDIKFHVLQFYSNITWLSMLSFFRFDI